MKKTKRWLVTVDNRSASLFSCSRARNGELHVEPTRVLKNEHEREHEFHRPTLLGGSERPGSSTRSSASAAPHNASPGHEIEEEHRRFAREFVLWVAQARLEDGDIPLDIFTAPHFIGFIRHELTNMHEAKDKFALHECELTHMSPAQLAQHPAVLDALHWSSAQAPR